VEPDWLLVPHDADFPRGDCRHWRGAARTTRDKAVVGLFALNINLNILWMACSAPAAGPRAAEAFLIHFALIVLLRRFSRTASAARALLVWVTYAAALNAAVVRLNGPFPGA
jgi:tryptophan-rich sensory protein